LETLATLIQTAKVRLVMLMAHMVVRTSVSLKPKMIAKMLLTTALTQGQHQQPVPAAIGGCSSTRITAQQQWEYQVSDSVCFQEVHLHLHLLECRYSH
jgi:hypothetical protein